MTTEGGGRVDSVITGGEGVSVITGRRVYIVITGRGLVWLLLVGSG